MDGDTVDALWTNVTDLLALCIASEFKGDPGFGQTNRAPAPPPQRKAAPRGPQRTQRPPQAQAADVPECNVCGGPVWDNRNNKRTENSPDFKCKDKSCGAAAWVNEEGLSWSD